MDFAETVAAWNSFWVLRDLIWEPVSKGLQKALNKTLNTVFEKFFF